MSPRRRDFISENRAAFGVKRICGVLGVSRSGYPADPCRTPLPREKDQPQAREQTDEDQPHRRTAPAAQEAHGA